MKTLKRQIIDAAIERQRIVIDDFKERIKEIMATDGNVNEEEYDNHHQSFKSESMSEVNLLSDELAFANKELEELRKVEGFEEHDHNCVEYGSVVKTDRKTFFVSASIEDFFVDTMAIFGISINAPIYRSMKGKKVGDSFDCGEHTYKILEIF